jgi:N-acetylated-alpha-linked acidic dipeptidase
MDHENHPERNGPRTELGISIRRIPAGIAGFLGVGLILTGSASGQQITGFSRVEAKAEHRAEAELIQQIQPSLLEELNRDMSREPHVAGSPAQIRVRDYIIQRFREWGLDPQVSTYNIYLPWPTEVSLALLTPREGSGRWDRKDFRLREEVVSGDPATRLEQYPWVNGYSGAGSVEAEVVYVNYGLHEDYARLAEAGVSVKGRVALARYGGSFRGIKARLAEEHGAVGLIMYSDPADDGYVRGDVYPEGPYRPASAVQRGSVIGHWGDPTTPGWASVEGAERLDPHREGHWVPAIPVIPLNWAAAQEILAGVRGVGIPDPSWQGGLGLRYHVGPGPAKLQLTVRHDDGYRDIHDVVAVVRGSELPDEWIVLGGHIDAWNAGSGDNVAGAASVMAAARAFAEMDRQGIRPKRTVIFAGWDAEEWGIIGSTEWAEEHRDALRAGGVAYLNQDGIAGGPRFSGSGSPSLKNFLVEAAEAVPHPDGGTLEEAWRAQQGAAPGTPLELGDLGGGSDYVGFYNHIGVPSLGHGFGGGSGIGHSAYDTYTFTTRFGDPGFKEHATSSRLVAVAALRLANATILPYDYERFGREMATIVADLATNEGRGEEERAALEELAQAFRRMEAAGRTLNVARTEALEGGIASARAQEANKHLLAVERAMTREGGLVGRPWFKNLIFAADYDNGYATIAVPTVQEAFKAGDTQRAIREAGDLTERVDGAIREIIAAIGALY